MMKENHEALQLDMDILEPYKIRIKVELINSTEIDEYIEILNQTFLNIRTTTKVFPLRFCKKNSDTSKILYETYKKTLGLLKIYDSTLNDNPLSDTALSDNYKELKSKSIQYEVEQLVILSSTQMDIKKIKEQTGEEFVHYSMISQNTGIRQKVGMIESPIRSIVGRVQDVLRRQISSSFEPTSIPWRMKEEVLVKPQDIYNKQKGRFEKWKADLCILSQSSEEAFIFLKNAMNECKAQNDYLWLISINMIRAATIVRGREIAGQKLLNTPLENDEAVRLVEETITEYGRTNEKYLELETTFKLINTYKNLEHKYAVLAKLKWIEQSLLGKWAKEDLVEVYARMANVCKELNYEKKATCYACKCLNNYDIKETGNDQFLKEIVKVAGLCDNPKILIAKSYEEALENAKIIEERIYLFEYKTLMEPDKLMLANKRLPENCTVYLKNKAPILKHNFQPHFYPDAQIILVKHMLNIMQQYETEINL